MLGCYIGDRTGIDSYLLLTFFSIFFLFFPSFFFHFLGYNSNDYSYSIMDATMESGYSFGCATITKPGKTIKICSRSYPIRTSHLYFHQQADRRSGLLEPPSPPSLTRQMPRAARFFFPLCQVVEQP